MLNTQFFSYFDLKILTFEILLQKHIKYLWANINKFLVKGPK